VIAMDAHAALGPCVAGSMGQPAAPHGTAPTVAIRGWRAFASDEGRLWATREKPFPDVATTAGAARTVDADDLGELADRVADQEALARDAGVTASDAEVAE
jgi:hypothetical protein